MQKAVFFDRDGIINEMVYDPENGVIHTPLNPDQITLVPKIADLLKVTKKLGYLNVLVSNQVNVGLGRISMTIHEKIRETIARKLADQGAHFDKEYYCFHHQFAKVEQYRKDCDCRKPKIGMFLQAAKELDIDLHQSYMIGDGMPDIIAGHDAGCKTILVTIIHEAGYLKIIEEKLGSIKPDYMVKHVKEIIPLFEEII